MTRTADAQEKCLEQTRLMRLTRYRSMQNHFERQQRQAVSRRRLLGLRGDPDWGWLAI